MAPSALLLLVATNAGSISKDTEVKEEVPVDK